MEQEIPAEEQKLNESAETHKETIQRVAPLRKVIFCRPIAINKSKSYPKKSSGFRKIININKKHKPYHTPKRKTEKRIKSMLLLSMKRNGKPPANAWKPGGKNPMRNPKTKAKQMQSKAITIELRRIDKKQGYYHSETPEMMDVGTRVNSSAFGIPNN